jgi:hypothetical protein
MESISEGGLKMSNIESVLGIDEKLTGVGALDKILLAVLGIGGMAAAGIMGAAGIYKMRPLDKFFSMGTLNTAKRAVVGAKLVWDTIDMPIRGWIKRKKPSLEKYRYAIDQGFDFLRTILGMQDIGKLFNQED